jgi:2'-5' RNA ligase
VAQPLILTLKMDDRSQELFDRLRERHFPRERNYLSAHLTLFHKLPGEHQARISADLQELCLHQTSFTLDATGLRFLGRGVAYELVSQKLMTLRRGLAERWRPWLGAQDRQGFKPHVTVQNKVSPERARALHGRLQATFSPFEVEGLGLSLWRYLDGPWEPASTYLFAEL